MTIKLLIHWQILTHFVLIIFVLGSNFAFFKHDDHIL